MSNRPTVGILGGDGASTGDTHPLPAVFSSPIRPDIVQYETTCIFRAFSYEDEISGRILS